VFADAGWQNWLTTAPVTVSPMPGGTQTLYVRFATSTGQNFANVNWFQFSWRWAIRQA
jgi:hypothetical protein